MNQQKNFNPKKVVAVEPCKNLANITKKKFKTYPEFWNLKLSKKNIKSFENIVLSDFDELESTIYDLSGRIAFMGDVHPDEKIRDFGNEADSKIQNFALEIFNDSNLYEKYKDIDILNIDEEDLSFHKDLGLDFKDAGHELSVEKKERLIEIEKKLIELGISFSENIAKDKTISAGKNIIKDTKDFQNEEWTEEKEKMDKIFSSK